MQKTEKKGVFELDQDRYSQMLLGKFLSGEIKTLEPVLILKEATAIQ